MKQKGEFALSNVADLLLVLLAVLVLLLLIYFLRDKAKELFETILDLLRL